ncbi:MAG: hypothetical protein SPL00_04230 [Bacilli bacterium]|nr:hypothetical protein [Bacilli bacterium]
MYKKKLRLLMTSILSVGAVSATILASNYISPSLNVKADIEPYTLTIDQNNFSNFYYVGDNLYRGTFKTALGNDITFTTSKNANLINNKIYWSNGDYLKNDIALSGLSKIEVYASVNKDQFRTYPKLRAEMLVDSDHPESFSYVDKLTNTESLATYTIDIPEEGSGNYLNLKIIEGTAQLLISSIKFYFNCSNTVNPIIVASNNDNYGTVSIEGSDNKRTAVKNGTSVTVHANPTSDYENELFYSFKGWHLNGSEEIISTNADYTFTTVNEASYNLTAEFVEAETELFSHGEHIADNAPHTFVYSEKAQKYYSIIGAHDPNGSYSHTSQEATRKNNELFVERHQWIQYSPSYKSYFKLNSYSPRHGYYDVKWVEDDQIEKFDPNKVQAVIFYLAMDESGRIDELSSTNGTFTTYRNLQDPLDGNKAMSKVVWTGFNTAVADVYVPSKYWNGEEDGTLWIKRMKVVYR